jgi:FixJ family two-component response regulator
MMIARRQVIAVVDDDESVCKAVCRLLRSAGFASRGFVSGQEFLESWLNEPPDCVVLDLRMPGMSGIEVQRKLNQLWGWTATIFITAHDHPQARQECLNAGAVAYLLKPMNAHQLLGAVHQAIGRKTH